MHNINRLIINKATASLSVNFTKHAFDNTACENAEHDNSSAIELSFEYLRVFAPTDDKGKAIALPPKVYHKKQVLLLKIESVGKHGYRFIFDDGHSNIYSSDYLQLLGAEYQQRWQHYLASTTTVVNSREATIEIKEVK